MFDKDGGYKSRKMVMAYVVMILMSAGFVATAKYPSLQAAYAEFCMGLMGAAGIFAGSNIAVKWASVRAQKKTALSEDKAASKQDDDVEEA